MWIYLRIYWDIRACPSPFGCSGSPAAAQTSACHFRSHPMRRYEGIDHRHVDAVGGDGLHKPVDHRLGDRGAALRHHRDDDLGRSARVEEQPTFQLARLDPVAQADRRDTTLDLLERIFEGDVPDPQAPRRRHAQQRPPCRHRDRLDKHQARLADRARRNRCRQEPPDEVPAVQPFPRRDRRRIAPPERGSPDRQ